MLWEGGGTLLTQDYEQDVKMAGCLADDGAELQQTLRHKTAAAAAPASSYTHKKAHDGRQKADSKQALPSHTGG